MKKFFVLIMSILVFAGCGKKGALIPPEALVPASVTDLEVAQKGDFFQLFWSQPTREAGGARLAGLAGFELFRREVLPPSEDCEHCPGAYRLLKKIDLDYLQEVERFDNRLLVNDNQVQTGKSYQYKIISRKQDGTPSPESNPARRQKVTPPLPAVLLAQSESTGIILELAPPLLEDGEILGYNIYRWRAGEKLPPFPLNDQPVSGNTYEDLRLERGVTYHYLARTVAKVAGETVESLPSNEVSGALTEPD